MLCFIPKVSQCVEVKSYSGKHTTVVSKSSQKEQMPSESETKKNHFLSGFC